MASGNGQPRTYTIATETANGSLNLDLLDQQIADNTNITTDLSYLGTYDAYLDAYFESTLSAGEITELDATVAAHDGYTLYAPVVQRWAKQIQQTTDLETWQNAIQRTSQPLEHGAYRFAWNLELQVIQTGPQLDSKALARISITTGDTTWVGYCATTETEWVSFSGWDVCDFNCGAEPVVQIEYRRDPTMGGNDSVGIRRARLLIEYIRDI